MQDLRLVAVTPEHTHLVLEDADSEQFRVPIDERLTAVLRRDRARPGQLEIALETPLTPRDIQTRIRAGESMHDLAAAAGMPVARVERYAAPVLAEREHVATLAQAAPSRRQSGGSAPTLGVVIEARLAEQHVAADSIVWDAWRTDEDRWTVHLSYLAGARERIAEWVFDPKGRVLVADNDEARWLVDEAQNERDEMPPARMRRLASVPLAESGEPEPQPSSGPDEVFDVEADRPDVVDVREAAAAPGHAPASRQAARGGRRRAVPSWDDIMFGARRRD